MDDLFSWNCTIEFILISLDFAMILQFLQCGYRHMDGRMDRQNNGQTDRIIGGKTNDWMDMQKTMIFQ